LAGAVLAVLVVAGCGAVEAAASRPPPAFEPSQMVLVPATSDVVVLGTATCGRRACAQLWLVADGGRHVVRLTAPPGASAPSRGWGVGIVFANLDDGYALAPTGSTGSHLSYTTDGGLVWHRADLRGLSGRVVASAGFFYALFGSCHGLENCRYRLGRSPIAAPHWTSVPIPGATGLMQGYISLAASGSTVWLYLQPNFRPVIAISPAGQPPFTEWSEPGLASVVACSLSPMAAGVVWSQCGTGMMVSWSRSTDGGKQFVHWWETAGTGGDAFDPLTGATAYRYTGIGPAPAYTLQVTTDGGATFRSVGRPFPDDIATPELAFTDIDHGYVLGGGQDGPLLYTSDGGEHWRDVVVP